MIHEHVNFFQKMINIMYNNYSEDKRNIKNLSLIILCLRNILIKPILFKIKINL